MNITESTFQVKSHTASTFYGPVDFIFQRSLLSEARTALFFSRSPTRFIHSFIHANGCRPTGSLRRGDILTLSFRSAFIVALRSPAHEPDIHQAPMRSSSTDCKWPPDGWAATARLFSALVSTAAQVTSYPPSAPYQSFRQNAVAVCERAACGSSQRGSCRENE